MNKFKLLCSAFRDRLARVRPPRLPLPTAPLYSPICQAAITALGILPLVCLFLQLALLVYGVQLPFSVVTLSAIAVFLLCAIRFYECLAAGFDRYDLSALAFMALVLLVSLRTLSAASLERLILFQMLPALLWVMRTLPHPRVYRGVAVVGGVLLADFYLLVAHTGVAAANGVNVILSDNVPDLTLGYSNPNETGIYLLLVLFLVLYGAALTRRLPELSISLILLSLSQMHLLILTESRTCILIGAFLYAAFLVSLVPSLRSLVTERVILIATLAIPLLFFLASYFNLFKLLGVSILHQSAESGRHEIYQNAIEALSPLDFLLGNQAAHAGENQHNAYLSLLSSYGLFALAAFVCLVYLFICRIRDVYRSHTGAFAYAFILALLLHASAEAAVFSAGGVYAILASIPFALASTHLPAPAPAGEAGGKRLVLINTLYRRGSTGMITEKLKQNAERAGYEVTAVHRYEGGEGYSDVIPATTWLDCHIHNRIARITGLSGFFSRIETAHLLRRLDELSPDLIHLHNLHASYLHLPSLFRYLKHREIKVVWTLHDCWALTGLCPYFSMLGCEKWESGCRACPYVREHREPHLDLTRFIHRQKRKWLTGLPSLTLVTPSRWLADLTRRSSYLSAYPVRTIYNGIDLDIFRPTESDFREKHGLPGKIVLLGVAFDWSERKGLDVFEWLAERLDERYAIVLVGVNEETRAALSDRILSVSRTDSQRELAEIYTAADLFVNPTREEALGLVNIEALACGTPGVTFASDGSPECYDESCGAVVAKDDNEALLREILRITETKPYSAEACIARARAFSADERYAEYIRLYEELIS